MTIRDKNDLLLQYLLIGYSQLKRGDASQLKKDLPQLKELIGVVYGAAEQVDGEFATGRGKPPVWSAVSRKICRDYPKERVRLTGIEKKLSSNEKTSGHLLKEILGDLVQVTNKVIDIQFDIFRIPIPKPPPDDGQEPPEEVPEEAPTIWDINNLKRIRSSGDFKTPGA